MLQKYKVSSAKLVSSFSKSTPKSLFGQVHSDATNSVRWAPQGVTEYEGKGSRDNSDGPQSLLQG